MNEQETSPLRNPRWLLLTLTLPILCFLLFWGKDLAIVSAEMTSRNWRAVLPVLILVILYGISGTVFSLIQTRKNQQIGVIPSLIFLIAAVVQMVLSACNLNRMCPDVDLFILPPYRWSCYSFTFLMPSAVYFMLVLASRLKGKMITYGAAVSVIGVPLLIYLSGVLFSRVSRWFGRNENIAIFFISSILVVFGILFFLAILRVLLLLISFIRNRIPQGRWCLPLIFGIVLPIGGLLLNRLVPFPCDLQHPFPYVMTVVNALILAIPVAGDRKRDLLLIGMKGAVYWFPLYFFLVFLPWIPLFVPAIIAMGAGFLILAPTFLFLLQNDFYVQDFRKMCLPRRQVIAAFLIGVILFPVLFFSYAFLDRTRLEYAVRTYYNTPYQMPLEEQKRVFQPEKLKRALDRYYCARNGLELPFLSEIYNAIAFRNLVISDSQFFRMYSDLFGLVEAPKTSMFPARNRFKPRPLSGLQDRSNENVTIASITGTPTETGAKVELKLTSDRGFNCEFEGSLTLPDGVFVTGLSLEIDGKMERGSIAERKTAIWIYEKITKTQRDPALLYYTGKNRLRLLVFPVTKKLPRRLELELIYPAGTAPELRLNETVCKLPVRGTPAVLEGRPVKRIPELILILDRSESYNEGLLTKLGNYLSKEFPDARTFRISSGLIAASSLSKAYPMKDFSEAFRQYQQEFQPGTPGFAAENVIKGTILNTMKLEKNGTFPVYVLWSGRKLYRSFDLLGFEEASPEFPYLVTVRFPDDHKLFRFGDMTQVNKDTKPAAVVQLPDGRIVSAENGIIPQIKGEGAYAAAQKLKGDSLKLLRDPSLEKELWVPLVRESIRSRVLIPQTSWIVLETEAQRRTLEKKQEEKLRSASAFDIENIGEIRADAPDTALLIIALILLLCVGIYRNRPWILRYFRRFRNG